MLDANLQSDRRWSSRYSVAIDANLRDSADVFFSVQMTDISQDGCGVSISPAAELQTDLLYTLMVPNFPSLDTYVIWTRDGRAGLAFTTPMNESILRRFAWKSLHDLIDKVKNLT